MKTTRPLERFHYKEQIRFGPDGEAWVSCSGAMAEQIARLHGLTPDRTRQELLELRTRTKMPVSALAACLGVPRITVRRWLDGTRRPSGAARKLVHIVHSIMVAKVKNIDLLDVGSWARESQDRGNLTAAENRPTPLEK